MKTLQQMLRELARPEVMEFALLSDRLPCVKIGDRYEPIDERTRSTEDILAMLVGAGGSRFVEELETKPAQWSTRIEAVGVVEVRAVMRGGRVQARFIASRRSRTVTAETEMGAAPARTKAADRGTVATPAAAYPPPAKQGEGTVAELGPAATGPAVTGPGPVAIGPEPAVTGPEPVAAVSDPFLRGAIFDPSKEAAAAAVEGRPGALPLARPSQAAMAALRVRPSKTNTAAVDVRPPAASGGAAPRPSLSMGATASASPSHLLDRRLAVARELGASDVHIVPGRPMLVRVGGELTAHGAVADETDVEETILSVVPDRLRSVLEEHGSCDFGLDRPPFGRFRVNVARQRTGYKACLRCIAPGVPTLASLGLPPEIERATHHHQGLVLVTGPTGHGKTSTLAAIVDIINRETTHHVITVEDPVEYVHPRKRAMISQREVGSTTRSFATALKGSLREDPDVIVVGELRDTETVRMALAASETGHLVLGTMNTPSAAKTIDRVIDLFPPADQAQVRMTLAGGLHLIVGQRLLPAASERGMVAAVELLPGSVALWSLIRDGKTFQIPSLQQRGRGFGILRLDESLADLVRAGKATRESALAYVESVEDFDVFISGRRGAPPPPEPTKRADAAGLLGKAGQIFGKRGA